MKEQEENIENYLKWIIRRVENKHGCVDALNKLSWVETLGATLYQLMKY
jgi:hypothetical protein